MNVRASHLLLALALSSLCACVSEVHSPGDKDGIGGTGVIANTSTDGIGGTGVLEPTNGDSDGIGGTGLWASAADVALYGVVTSTEPLTLNGHSMFVDTQTNYTLNGEPANQNALQLGSVAWVKAGIRDGGIFANEVMLESHVRGPIESYDEPSGLIRVLGQNVQLSDHDTMLDLDFKQLTKTAISEGRWIEVAGIRRNAGTVDASLIKLAEKETTAFVRGFVVEAGARNYRIGDLLIGELAIDSGPQQAIQVLVTGLVKSTDSGASKLQITSSIASPALPFINEVSYFSVQGFFSAKASNSGGGSFAGLPQVLEVSPRISSDISTISTSEPVVLDFEAGGMPNTLKVLRVNRLNPLQPGTMLIPQYKPQLPVGEFTGRGGMRSEHQDPTNTILLPPNADNSVQKTTIIPNTTPSLSPVRPEINVDAPAGPPQIRTSPPVDVVRPQLPDAHPPSVDILPGSIGPR